MGDAGSVLLMVSTPEVMPFVDGAYVTFTAQEEPAFRVVSPHVLLTVKSAVALNDRPSTAAALVFARVSAWVAVLPTTTSPKLMAVGEVTSCGWVPTPERGTVKGCDVAEDARDRVARTVPTAAGLNVTAMVQLPPAASTEPAPPHGVPLLEPGRVKLGSPARLYTPSVTGWLPVFDTEASNDAALSTRTRPNSSVAGVSVRLCGWLGLCAAMEPSRLTNSSDAPLSLCNSNAPRVVVCVCGTYCTDTVQVLFGDTVPQAEVAVKPLVSSGTWK